MVRVRDLEGNVPADATQRLLGDDNTLRHQARRSPTALRPMPSAEARRGPGKHVS
jgi:hypothetical protein